MTRPGSADADAAAGRVERERRRELRLQIRDALRRCDQRHMDLLMLRLLILGGYELYEIQPVMFAELGRCPAEVQRWWAAPCELHRQPR